MNEQQQTHLILAYYHLATIENPHEEVIRHKEFFTNRDVTCRIYISEQGINGQMSAARQDGLDYISWMQTRPEFAGIMFKVQGYHENVFPRMTVKYRKQLVALDAPANLAERGEHVPPEKWKQMLVELQNKILLDVRNDYEWKIGRFDGAELPPCETFREFNQYADQLKENVDPSKTPVMMYCTGGIRCELYSAVLKEKGFEKVYQLEGGVINYGMKEGSDHWLGKLFVFDDRLAVPLSGEGSSKVIGTCHHCGVSNETYYNCANMDCNELFMCCPDCLKEFSGCCQSSCTGSERLRPYQHCTHKPFKKWYNYSDAGISKVKKQKKNAHVLETTIEIN